MINNLSKSILPALTLIAVLATLALVFNMPETKVFAQEQTLTCPLKREAPIGQLIDQTSVSAGKILDNIEIIILSASQTLRSGKRMIDLSGQCKAENCQASCQSGTTYGPRDGTPTTLCSSGYTCSDPNVYQGNDPLVSSLDCVKLDLDPRGTIDIDSERFYGVFDWRENSGYPCNPYDCPDPSFYPGPANPGDDLFYPAPESNCTSGDTCYYKGYTITGQEIINGGYSQQNCKNLPNYLTVDASATYAIYQWSGVHGGGWCNVLWPTTTCYETCYNEDDCSVDWTEESTTCEAQACSGQACPFTDIEGELQKINDADERIVNAVQTIVDFFDKKITELPILGELCKNEVLNIPCDKPWMFKSEFDILVHLLDKTMKNVRGCQTSIFDLGRMLLEGTSGWTLFSCESLVPGVFNKCYPLNYFCCQ